MTDFQRHESGDERFISSIEDLADRITPISTALVETAQALDDLTTWIDEDDLFFREYERRRQIAREAFGGMERDMTDDDLIEALTNFEDIFRLADAIRHNVAAGNYDVLQTNVDVLCAELTDGLRHMRPLIVRAASSIAGHHIPNFFTGLLELVDAPQPREN
ncbi:hypothetical protein [Paraburkholderia sp. MM5477-R1]|uniref:hypothetical protein n=1 Tax=Paraburkholderia sp. MM5477-R1 TaxID=2991062 RepID=UPI003D23BDA5